MSTLLVACLACRREFRVVERLQGRTIACPHCRKPVVVAAKAEPADRLVGQESAGCRLIRRLGAGALGVVYEAERAGRQVAIKLLSSQAAQDAEVVARFQREAGIARGVTHPNLVAVLDSGHARGTHYLVMEFVPGGTLAALVEDGPIPWRDAVRHGAAIAEVLAALHAREIIHRDLKPANVLIGADGVARLADLGLAKRIESQGDPAQGLTMQGTSMGSPAYMPPEQVTDARSAGPTADLYSLGATIYHLVAGRAPFVGKLGSEVMEKVLNELPADPRQFAPDCPAALAELILALLAKDPADRPQSAAEVAATFNAIIAGTTAIRRIPPRRKPVQKRSRWWPWLLVAVVLVAAGIGVWLVATHRI